MTWDNVGLLCGRSEKEIKKVAFAVDACEETALAAVKEGADVLFVHHGLFWGNSETITGAFYKKISILQEIAFHQQPYCQ